MLGFSNLDISLPSSHSNSILFPLLLHKRYLQGGYDTSLLVCVLCATVFSSCFVLHKLRGMNVNLRLHESYLCLESS